MRFRPRESSAGPTREPSNANGSTYPRGATLSETVSQRVDLIVGIPSRGAKPPVPMGRCPRCGLPQGPFAERHGRSVICVACRAHFLEDGTLLY